MRKEIHRIPDLLSDALALVLLKRGFTDKWLGLRQHHRACLTAQKFGICSAKNTLCKILVTNFNHLNLGDRKSHYHRVHSQVVFAGSQGNYIVRLAT